MLRDFRGTESNDRENSEQTQTESKSDLGGAEHGCHSHDADIDTEEGDDKVAPVVASVEETDGQHERRHDVDPDEHQ